ncbi:uncharacterized protein LOC111086531 [Limulus polyphemus]|uniref:Uncharacterized protein LOC111086531 n=1 Tax=Limulus polyphemus TaxID=6850 RepID=A0ABM1SP70_LIMPO|nr:uncharacterized protein LOC111086531 [Limulus polyphemus]XP_022245427.1 uncharacterized protein LOC111086531 [Limulus polyphemus]
MFKCKVKMSLSSQEDSQPVGPGACKSGGVMILGQELKLTVEDYQENKLSETSKEEHAKDFQKPDFEVIIYSPSPLDELKGFQELKECPSPVDWSIFFEQMTSDCSVPDANVELKNDNGYHPCEFDENHKFYTEEECVSSPFLKDNTCMGNTVHENAFSTKNVARSKVNKNIFPYEQTTVTIDDCKGDFSCNESDSVYSNHVKETVQEVPAVVKNAYSKFSKRSVLHECDELASLYRRNKIKLAGQSADAETGKSWLKTIQDDVKGLEKGMDSTSSNKKISYISSLLDDCDDSSSVSNHHQYDDVNVGEKMTVNCELDCTADSCNSKSLLDNSTQMSNCSETNSDAGDSNTTSFSQKQNCDNTDKDFQRRELVNGSEKEDETNFQTILNYSQGEKNDTYVTLLEKLNNNIDVIVPETTERSEMFHCEPPETNSKATLLVRQKCLYFRNNEIEERNSNNQLSKNTSLTSKRFLISSSQDNQIPVKKVKIEENIEDTITIRVQDHCDIDSSSITDDVKTKHQPLNKQFQDCGIEVCKTTLEAQCIDGNEEFGMYGCQNILQAQTTDKIKNSVANICQKNSQDQIIDTDMQECNIEIPVTNFEAQTTDEIKNSVANICPTNSQDQIIDTDMQECNVEITVTNFETQSCDQTNNYDKLKCSMDVSHTCHPVQFMYHTKYCNGCDANTYKTKLQIQCTDHNNELECGVVISKKDLPTQFIEKTNDSRAQDNDEDVLTFHNKLIDLTKTTNKNNCTVEGSEKTVSQFQLNDQNINIFTQECIVGFCQSQLMQQNEEQEYNKGISHTFTDHTNVCDKQQCSLQASQNLFNIQTLAYDVSEGGVEVSHSQFCDQITNSDTLRCYERACQTVFQAQLDNQQNSTNTMGFIVDVSQTTLHVQPTDKPNNTDTLESVVDISQTTLQSQLPDQSNNSITLECLAEPNASDIGVFRTVNITQTTDKKNRYNTQKSDLDACQIVQKMQKTDQLLKSNTLKGGNVCQTVLQSQLIEQPNISDIFESDLNTFQAALQNHLTCQPNKMFECDIGKYEKTCLIQLMDQNSDYNTLDGDVHACPTIFQNQLNYQPNNSDSLECYVNTYETSLQTDLSDKPKNSNKLECSSKLITIVTDVCNTVHKTQMDYQTYKPNALKNGLYIYQTVHKTQMTDQINKFNALKSDDICPTDVESQLIDQLRISNTYECDVDTSQTVFQNQLTYQSNYCNILKGDVNVCSTSLKNQLNCQPNKSDTLKCDINVFETQMTDQQNNFDTSKYDIEVSQMKHQYHLIDHQDIPHTIESNVGDCQILLKTQFTDEQNDAGILGCDVDVCHTTLKTNLTDHISNSDLQISHSTKYYCGSNTGLMQTQPTVHYKGCGIHVCKMNFLALSTDPFTNSDIKKFSAGIYQNLRNVQSNNENKNLEVQTYQTSISTDHENTKFDNTEDWDQSKNSDAAFPKKALYALHAVDQPSLFMPHKKSLRDKNIQTVLHGFHLMDSGQLSTANDQFVPQSEEYVQKSDDDLSKTLYEKAFNWTSSSLVSHSLANQSEPEEVRSRPLRVGLSRRQKVKPLHPYFIEKAA